VYRLPAGSRIADALAAAGGARADADLAALNLARPLADGEQVLVPAPGDPPAVAAPPAASRGTGGAAVSGGTGGGAAGAAGSGARRPDGLLDLNLAGAADLDELPGVGPVLAQRILDHRAAIGRFTSVDELRDVKGIGEATFADLAPQVTV
jgi:competence protein ComEA